MKISRRSFLATSCLSAAAMAGGASGLAASDPRLGRFNGTVAIFYIAHFQLVQRDWNSIEEYKGPYHPLLGYYGYKRQTGSDPETRYAES